jgi:hypothetical protein
MTEWPQDKCQMDSTYATCQHINPLDNPPVVPAGEHWLFGLRISNDPVAKILESEECRTRDVSLYTEYCDTHKQDASLCHLTVPALMVGLDNFKLDYEEPKE